MATNMHLNPLSSEIGTEVTGLDLSEPVDPDVLGRLEIALEQTGLLVFRDQNLTPTQHAAFSRRFGDLEVYPMRQFTLPDAPEVLIISTVIENGEPIGVVDAGLYWHTDSSWRPVPSLGSLLYARELPAEGGDTLFVDQHKVYEALPDDLKGRIKGLTGVHDYARRNMILSSKPGGRPALTEEQRKATPPATHPLVCRHPRTGRPHLYINEGFVFRIAELSEDESAELLSYLFAFSTSSRFVYRHKWKDNDLVFWDNRSGLHCGDGCPPGQRRTMHRTTIKGEAPVAFV